jgi:hypothetical protein
MGRYLETHSELMTEFYTPFIVGVSFDTIRNKKYSILPAGFARLKESFIMISPIQNEEEQFIHTNSGDEWLFHGLEAENNEGQASYKIEGNRVWYKNIEPEFTQVLVRMVANIIDLPDTAVFPVPQMFEQKILDYVLSKLQIQETVPLKAENKPDA